MRTRAAVLAAVVAFAVAVTGVALVAARSGGGSGLERLPFAATGAERDVAMSSPAGVVEYVLKGSLPSLPDEAPAYRLVDEEPSDASRRFTAAFGFKQVTVERAPGLPWYLASAEPDHAVSSCPVYPVAPDRPPVGRPEIGSCLGGSPVPRPVAGLPPKAEAERIARDVLGKLGVSTEGLELLGGTYSWEAVVSPSVGGLPTRGLETGLSIGPAGEITAAHGFLGTPDRIGDYPLAGPAAGFERLQKGVGIGPQPLAARDIAIGVERQVVTVTGARLALLHVGELLVPVYEFLTDAGGALTAPAVTDRWLAEHEPQANEPEPAPGPDRGSGSGGSSGSGSCSASSSAASSDDDNAPLTVEVCVEPAKAEVGEEVVFRVTAADRDAPIVDSDCASPTVAFGDGQPAQPDCGIACTLAKPLTPKPTPRKSGQAVRTFTHVYAAPGTYTARFGFQSGPCTEWASQGQGSVDVFVYE